MWPSMVGVVHCAHTGAAAAQVSESRRAIFIRGERYMQILVSSLAWVWPAVADWKQIVAARLSKVASTLVPLHRALIGPGKRHKMYTNLPLRAEQIFFPPRPNRVFASQSPESAKPGNPVLHPTSRELRSPP